MAEPYFILATGQSNMEIQRAYSWAPNSRAKTWNNSIGDDTSVGSAYVPLSGTEVGVASRYAHRIAEADPNKNVFMARYTRGARDILHWVGGGFWNISGSGVGACGLNAAPNAATFLTMSTVDVLGIRRPFMVSNLIVGEKVWITLGSVQYMYTITGTPAVTFDGAVIPIAYVSGSGALTGNVQITFQPRFLTQIENSVPAALAAAGKSTIDMLLWWQGESDHEFNTRYEIEFEFLMSYLSSKPWWGPQTKIVICGMNSTAGTGYPTADVMNSRLSALASSAGNRYFANLAALVAPSRWNEVYHMTGQGYAESGEHLFLTYAPPLVLSSGATLRVRNSTNSGWINAASATGFRIRNASNTGWINKTGTLSGYAVRNATNTGWITFTGGSSVSYSIVPNVSSINEGGTVTYTINTTGFGSGTLYWTNAGTTNAADFTDGLNSGAITITSNVGTLTRTLVNDLTTEGTEGIVIQLRTGSIGGPVVGTATSVTVVDTSLTPSFPSSMVMTRNNLEFLYSGYKTTSASTGYMEVIMTLDTSAFFNLATNTNDHIGVALNTAGDASVFAPDGTRDHCGAIIRHGMPLWDVARGFIIFRDGRIWSEHWYEGAPAGTPGFGYTDFGYCFNPLLVPVFTVRIRAGYRVGTYGERMAIDVFAGSGTGGTLLAGLESPWGWDYSGNHRFTLFGIATGFVAPSATGCVETSAAGSAYGATVGISNFNFNVYNV